MKILSLLFCAALTLRAGEPLVMVANTSGSFKSLPKSALVDLLKGESTQVNGKRVTIFLTKPSSKSLPAVTYGLLGMAPTAYLSLIKQAKMRGVNIEVEFAESVEALEASVAANPAAIGFLAKSEAKGTKTILVSLD